MLTAIVVVFVFSVVVVVHEMGHFLMCKLFGVRVEQFAIGFGKELFGFNWGQTRWSFCLLPLGGFVKPAGDEVEASSGAPDEFFGQSWLHRALIAIAGPIMNYFLAFFCFFVLMFFWGQPQPSQDPIIGELVTGYPAQVAGLQKGDRILAINGVEIATWDDAAKLIHSNPEKPVDLKYRRDVPGSASLEKITAVVPKKDPQRSVGLIGISPTMEMKPEGFTGAIKSAADQTIFWTKLTLKYLGSAIVHRKTPELAGPIGIVSIVAKVAKEGIQELISLIALLSLSLGLFNFFPIPLLDGGHVFLYLIEGALGHPLNKKAVRVANIVGATFLLAVFLFATTQDISRLRSTLWR